MTDLPAFAPLGDTAVAPSVAAAATDPERARIAEGTADQPGRWWAFGPYVSERAWGTVREDYSPDGRASDYFPHDHARSRAYRWSEDGLAGLCDVEQRLCFALAFWNGRDTILTAAPVARYRRGADTLRARGLGVVVGEHRRRPRSRRRARCSGRCPDARDRGGGVADPQACARASGPARQRRRPDDAPPAADRFHVRGFNEVRDWTWSEA